MLSIGQQLYELSRKDELDVRLAPFFRNSDVPYPIGVSVLQTEFPVPSDRFVMLQNWCVQISTNGGVISAFRVALFHPGQTFLIHQAQANVVGDNQTTAGNSLAGISRSPNILCPPGSVIQFSVERTSTVAIGNFRVSLQGYAIPPGNIVRFP